MSDKTIIYLIMKSSQDRLGREDGGGGGVDRLEVTHRVYFSVNSRRSTPLPWPQSVIFGSQQNSISLLLDERANPYSAHVWYLPQQSLLCLQWCADLSKGCREFDIAVCQRSDTRNKDCPSVFLRHIFEVQFSVLP